MIWLPKIRKRSSSANNNNNKQQDKPLPMKKMIKSGVAWQVTLALGPNKKGYGVATLLLTTVLMYSLGDKPNLPLKR